MNTRTSKRVLSTIFQSLLVLLTIVIYLVPYYFVIINSAKTKKESARMTIQPPSDFSFSQVWENYHEVLTADKFLVLRAFRNSIILSVVSVVLVIVFASMLAYIIQRRKDKLSNMLNYFILAGLIVPVSIVPTARMLQFLHLNGMLLGLILVEIATQISFATILFRGYFPSIPREIDEAAILDGCGPLRLFGSVILPLSKPIISTVIVLCSLHVYNDFTNPLYFLPGSKNTTVQLSINQFYGMYESSWNLIFADVVLISIPMLVLYMIFNKRIEAGMVSGAVKG